MVIAIRETKVIPHHGGALVEMLISDEALGGPDAQFSVYLKAKPSLPNLPAKTILATIQVLALQVVQKQLMEVLVALRKSVERPLREGDENGLAAWEVGQPLP